MKKQLTAISSIIEDIFTKKSAKFSEIYFLFQLNQSWAKIAGQEISTGSKPLQFKNNQLILSLPNSSQLQEMHFAKEKLKEKINKTFPDHTVYKIILKVQAK